jgi:hypothetical protein
MVEPASRRCVDEVGSAPKRDGADLGNGYGTGTVGGSSWAGWGAS